MGTRGYFGFYYKGTFYIMYNHWDSYPRGLGTILVREIVRVIKGERFPEWLARLKNLTSVEEEDNDELYLENEDQKDSTGYEPSFELILKSKKTCFESKIIEPSWEEFAYIINFDENHFEFYANSKLAMAQKLELDSMEKLLSVFELCVN